MLAAAAEPGTRALSRFRLRSYAARRRTDPAREKTAWPLGDWNPVFPLWRPGRPSRTRVQPDPSGQDSGHRSHLVGCPQKLCGGPSHTGDAAAVGVTVTRGWCRRRHAVMHVNGIASYRTQIRRKHAIGGPFRPAPVSTYGQGESPDVSRVEAKVPPRAPRPRVWPLRAALRHRIDRSRRSAPPS